MEVFKQEVGDDLSVCILSLLSEVNTLPSLVAISPVKVEKQFFQFVTRSKIHITLRMGSSHVRSPSLAKFGTHRYSASGDIMYLICYLISLDHIIRRPPIFISGSFS